MTLLNKPLSYDCYDAVVLANGCMPERASLLKLLEHAPILVCCDGAASHLYELHIEPTAVIGDCDSLSDELLSHWRDRVERSDDQETNDLTKAMAWLNERMERGRIAILGATGKRDDHTLGNLSLLRDYNELKPEHWNVSILTDYGVFDICKAPGAVMESFPKQQVSIIMPDRQVPLSVDGLKYPIRNRILEAWWQGTLNESLGHSFEIRLDQGQALVFRSFDPS